ncbi:MAG: hypothetical protein IT518_19650 [Burkholderiales bacterium]|nr:hypothetical protein [Burkholderiales bacterium]
MVEPDRLQRMTQPGAAPAWLSTHSNNYGFLSAHDYPYAPAARSFIIGIFGGSVAQWFALQGAARLQAELRTAPAWRDRDIVVLNFAAGGYKQPQQLLLLNFLLAIGQRLDYAVNIDGFNEVALAGINVAAGTAAAMPSVQHMDPLAALASLPSERGRFAQLAELDDAKMRLADLRASSSPLALGWLLDSLRQRILARRIQALAQALAGGGTPRSLIELVPAESASGGIEQAAALWAQTSQLMQRSLDAQRIPYLQILQPNQYFGHKPMRADELRIAVNLQSGYRPFVEAGYPLLRAAVPQLRAAGVAVLDATALFDNDADTIYADDCCHFNQRGNDALAKLVAAAILEATQRAPASAARMEPGR